MKGIEMETETVRGCLDYESMYSVRNNAGLMETYELVKVDKTFGEWNRGSRVVCTVDVSFDLSESIFVFEYVDNNLDWKRLGSATVRFGENMIVKDFFLNDHASKTILHGRELWEELEQGEILFAMFEALDKDSMW